MCDLFSTNTCLKRKILFSFLFTSLFTINAIAAPAPAPAATSSVQGVNPGTIVTIPETSKTNENGSITTTSQEKSTVTGVVFDRTVTTFPNNDSEFKSIREIKITDPNGATKETKMEEKTDGTVSGTSKTSDGSVGVISGTNSPDGNRTMHEEIKKTDGTTIVTDTATHPDNSQESNVKTTNPDGSVKELFKTESPDNSRTIDTIETKPDGTVREVNQIFQPDKTVEQKTTISNPDGSSSETTLKLNADKSGSLNVVEKNSDGDVVLEGIASILAIFV